MRLALVLMGASTLIASVGTTGAATSTGQFIYLTLALIGNFLVAALIRRRAVLMCCCLVLAFWCAFFWYGNRALFAYGPGTHALLTLPLLLALAALTVAVIYEE